MQALASASMAVRPRADGFARAFPIAVLLAIFTLGAALRLHYFDPGISRTPDERTYTRQANLVLAQGAEGFRFIGRELDADISAVSVYPSPLRVGYITLLAAFMRLTGDTSAVAGARLSVLCSLASLVLIAGVAYRFLSFQCALVATLFFAVFPLDLVIARRAWQESFISLMTMATVALSVGIARSIRRSVCLAAFAVVGFLALTTKENSGLCFLLCAAGLVLHLLRAGDRRAAILTAGAAAASIAAYCATLSLLFGGFLHAFALIGAYVRISAASSYDLQNNSGPLWIFPAGLLLASPFLFLAALAGFVAVGRRAAAARGGLPLGIALITAFMLLVQVGTNRYSLRYTAPILGPICLLAGIGADAAMSRMQRLLAPLGRGAAWTVLGCFILVAAYRDLNYARDNLLLPEVQDLAVRPMLGMPPNALFLQKRR